jgi:hypothetical protein
MATTMFFEETVQDKEGEASIELEFGRSSYYHGESLVYLTINGTTVILDEKVGRKLCEAMDDLAAYLGYRR